MSINKNLTNPIVLLSFIGMLIGISLIYMARNQSFGDEENGESLGYVGEATDDVRLKRVGNMHWYVAEVEQELFEGDLVFSGDKARTVLKLRDHGTLTLGPYSMVVIQAGYIQVESGEVELKADRNTTIKTFGEEIKVSTNSSTKIVDRPSDKRLELSDKDEKKIANIRAQELLKDVIQKDKEAAAQKKPEIVELIVAGLESLWEPQKKKMVLTFRSPAAFDKVEMVVKNDAFEKVFVGRDTVELQNLPAGTYRVTGFGYQNGVMVSKSAEAPMQIVIPLKTPDQKHGVPTLKDSNIEFSL